MSRVLFLVHRIPYPPDKGDKIRSYNILRYLCSHNRVYLGAFVDNDEDFQYLKDMEGLCAGVKLRPVGGWRSWVGALLALLTGRSLGVGYYRDRQMSEWVRALIEREKIEAVLIFSSVMAQHAPLDDRSGVTVVADFVDVDSDKWIQYGQEKPFPLNLMYRYEGHTLARWEVDVSKSVDAVTLVSSTEHDLLQNTLRDRQQRVEVVKNGVDADYFDPGLEYENPYRDGVRSIVFTGAMDYFANEEAVVWFSESIFPQLRKEAPDLQFVIVGSSPTDAVKALERDEGVVVTGRVADIRPYLHHAVLAVAPLALARGVQNKVLEALAMEVPVVATPQAVQGIEADLPGTISVAERGESFVAAIHRRLESDGRDTGGAGRMFVREHYNWNRNLADFSRLLSLQ